MDEGQKAYAAALRMLTRRDHSRAELAGKLAAKGFPEAVVTELLERLIALGYLDDRRFARQWGGAAARSGRGIGPRIALELRRRGIADDTVREVLAEISAEYAEGDLLREQMHRRYAAFDPLTATDREKARIFSYFRRRGFSGGAIAAALRGLPEQE
jgi:regulatory protein